MPERPFPVGPRRGHHPDPGRVAELLHRGARPTAFGELRPVRLPAGVGRLLPPHPPADGGRGPGLGHIAWRSGARSTRQRWRASRQRGAARAGTRVRRARARLPLQEPGRAPPRGVLGGGAARGAPELVSPFPNRPQRYVRRRRAPLHRPRHHRHRRPRGRHRLVPGTHGHAGHGVHGHPRPAGLVSLGMTMRAEPSTSASSGTHPRARRVNHVAYFVESREELLRVADVLLNADVAIEFGPGKHGWVSRTASMSASPAASGSRSTPAATATTSPTGRSSATSRSRARTSSTRTSGWRTRCSSLSAGRARARRGRGSPGRHGVIQPGGSHRSLESAERVSTGRVAGKVVVVTGAAGGQARPRYGWSCAKGRPSSSMTSATTPEYPAGAGTVAYHRLTSAGQRFGTRSWRSCARGTAPSTASSTTPASRTGRAWATSRSRTGTGARRQRDRRAARDQFHTADAARLLDRHRRLRCALTAHYTVAYTASKWALRIVARREHGARPARDPRQLDPPELHRDRDDRVGPSRVPGGFAARSHSGASERPTTSRRSSASCSRTSRRT